MSKIVRIVRCAGLVLLLFAPLHWSKADETKLFIFWETVSPDGKYALGWSTSGSLDADDLADDMDKQNSNLKNGLVDVTSRKMLLVLPGAEYWDLPPNGTHPNHYSMSTVWSDDSASLLAITPAGKLSSIKSEKLGDDLGESDDRQLNRAYRSLIGLLTSDERKALIEEERAWIGQRDAAKSEQAKDDLVAARIQELSKRLESKIEALRAADGEKMPK